MATEKEKKAPKVKLDLVHDAEKLVAVVQKECMTRVYDKKKIEERLNCRGDQARTLIVLAQLADAQGSGSGKAAKA
jgi:hypothetical protein